MKHFISAAKFAAIMCAPHLVLTITLVTIGAIAEHVDKKRRHAEIEHFANCPKNHV